MFIKLIDKYPFQFFAGLGLIEVILAVILIQHPETVKEVVLIMVGLPMFTVGALFILLIDKVLPDKE